MVSIVGSGQTFSAGESIYWQEFKDVQAGIGLNKTSLDLHWSSLRQCWFTVSWLHETPTMAWTFFVMFESAEHEI